MQVRDYYFFRVSNHFQVLNCIVEKKIVIPLVVFEDLHIHMARAAKGINKEYNTGKLTLIHQTMSVQESREKV